MEEKTPQKPRQKLINMKYRRLEVKSLKEAVEEADTRLTRISPVLSDMPKSGNNCDKMADGVAKLIELKQKLNRMVHQAAAEECEVMDNIEKIENPLYRTILMSVYDRGKDLYTVSQEVNYHYNYTCRLHGYALDEYDKVAKSE
jgi:hypothetical protein